MFMDIDGNSEMLNNYNIYQSCGRKIRVETENRYRANNSFLLTRITPT